jgi:hypothetical protein
MERYGIKKGTIHQVFYTSQIFDDESQSFRFVLCPALNYRLRSWEQLVTNWLHDDREKNRITTSVYPFVTFFLRNE